MTAWMPTPKHPAVNPLFAIRVNMVDGLEPNGPEITRDEGREART